MLKLQPSEPQSLYGKHYYLVTNNRHCSQSRDGSAPESLAWPRFVALIGPLQSDDQLDAIEDGTSLYGERCHFT